MTIALLVAGRGTRFIEGRSKCLMDVGSTTLLERTISLIRNCSKDVEILVITGNMAEEVKGVADGIGDERIRTVHNADFAIDQNILSAQVAMAASEGDILIIEGDCIYNQQSIDEMVSRIGTGNNIIFSHGSADPLANNAIIDADGGVFKGYQKGPRDSTDDYSSWSNMGGATMFNEAGRMATMSILENEGMDSSSTYYFQALLDDAVDLDTRVHRFNEGGIFRTFNTEYEYLDVMQAIDAKTTIQLFPVSRLVHVEGFSQKRVDWLKNKIIEEGVWNRPICIDGEFGIVMDGQHRMEVAKAMGLERVPAILFTHDEVEFWSLRDSHDVSKELIMTNLEKGDAYPYKTVKYRFPIDIPQCNLKVEELA